MMALEPIQDAEPTHEEVMAALLVEFCTEYINDELMPYAVQWVKDHQEKCMQSSIWKEA